MWEWTCSQLNLIYDTGIFVYFSVSDSFVVYCVYEIRVYLLRVCLLLIEVTSIVVYALYNG